VRAQPAARSADDVEQTARDEDQLAHGGAAHEGLDGLVLQQLFAVGLGQAGRHHDARAHLALDLDGDLHLVSDELILVIRRPALRVDRLAEAALFPHFLSDVRGNRVEAQHQGLEFAAGDLAVRIDIVDEGHHRRDGGVELHALVVLGHLLDHGVDRNFHLLAHALLFHEHILQTPDALKEAAAAARALRGPRNRLIERAHEHLVQTERIRADFRDGVVRIDDVAAGLGHLFAVGAQDHAVAGALLVGLLVRDRADIVEEQVPEAGIEQVQRGVLHAAVVPVDRQPVLKLFPAGEVGVAVRIGIAQEIPAGTGPLRHGIGLALGGTGAARAGGVHPGIDLGERGLAGIGRLIVVNLRQEHRQLIFRHRNPAALLAINQRDRLAPVALAGEDPVAQLEVDLLLAQALFSQPGDDALLRLRNGQSIKEAGVAEHALLNVGVGSLLHILAAGDDLDDRQTELGSEVPVAGVMRRNGHDRAGAVGDEHIVGNEDRDQLAVDRVDRLDALELDAGLILGQLGALKVALLGSGLAVGDDIVPIFDAVLHRVDRGMLRSDDHVRRAEERIGAGGIHAQLHIGISDGEVDLRALAAADPVALLGLDLLDEVDVVKTVEQLLAVLGDLEHPLALDAADDLRAAALTLAGDDLFVRQAALAARAPVDRHLALVGEAVLVELQEDPLGPLKVVGIGGVDLAGPVKGETDALELIAEVVDVLLRHARGMDVVLDGEVLRRQAEGVPAHRVKDVVALQTALAGDDVHRRVGTRMADMQARAGRIGEFDQAEELGLALVALRLKAMRLLPVFLPLEFDLFGIVNLAHWFCPP